MSNRKIWSIPIAALAVMLMLAAALVTTGIVQATTGGATVPSTMTVVSNGVSSSPVVVYEVANYTPPADGTTGTGPLSTTAAFTKVTKQLDKDGNNVPLTAAASRAVFSAAFATASTESNAVAPANKNRVTLSVSSNALANGNTYTVDVYAAYDKDRASDAAADSLNPDGSDATWDNDDDNTNDLDGSIKTTVTVHVPYVVGAGNVDTANAPIRKFYVQSDSVVTNNVISGIGFDRISNPLGWTISNLPSGVTAEVVESTDNPNANYDFELKDNKIVVKAQTNADGDSTLTGSINVKFSYDHDLDGSTTDGSIGLTTAVFPQIVADVDPVPTFGTDPSDQGLEFIPTAGSNAPIAVTSDNPHHYKRTIPETTPKGTGVLAYHVGGGVTAVTQAPTHPAEDISGIISGPHADKFAVNDTTDAIEYVGETGALTAGEKYVLTLTANGSSGIAGRSIVGSVEITISAVNLPPTVPANMSVTLNEDDKGGKSTTPTVGGLVKNNAVVHDFAGIGSDPEGRTLTFSTTAAGFDFDGTKLMVDLPNGIPDIARGDNGATANVTETNWPMTASVSGSPVAAADDWAFDPDPPTNMYPDQSRTIEVVASDGAQSNNQTIKVKVTLKMNTPVMTADPLPSGVTMNATTGYYEFTAPDAIARTFEATLIDLDTVFSNDMATDKVTYKVVARPAATLGGDARPAPSDVEVDGNKLILTNVETPPEGSDTLTRTVRVTAVDDFTQFEDTIAEDSDAKADADMTFTITVKVILPDSDFVNANVPENSAAGSLTPMLTADGRLDEDPAGADSDVTYALYTQSNNGTLTAPSFALNAATGEITVVNGRDFETDAALTTLVVEVRKLDASGTRLNLGQVIFNITTTNENEAPTFGAAPSLSISEKAQVNTNVGAPIAASDVDAGDMISYSIKETDVPFSVMKTDTGGQIQVAGALSLADSPYSVTLVATDNGGMMAELALSIEVGDENDAPMFDTPYMTEFKVNEQDSAAAQDLATYDATDVDGTDALQGVKFVLTDSDDARHFVMTNQTNDTTGEHEGVLSVKAGANLDVDAAGTKSEYELLLAVCDKLNACSEKIDITVTIAPQNDNAPVINSGAREHESVYENAARGTVIGNYSAVDADGDTVTYSLGGADSKSFSISNEAEDAGALKTLEALDYDGKTPCASTGCEIKVIASDGEKSAEMQVTIRVDDVDDSVSAFSVSKANPIANISTEGDDAMTALADGKTTESKAVPESPANLPAMMGDEPSNFVSTDWANWDTVLRIEVTAESPDSKCGINDLQPSGNECVFVSVEGKESKHDLILKAFRSSEKDNMFIAAVKVVRKDQGTDASGPVYKHNGSGVAQLEAEEEDDIDIRLVMKNDKGGFDDSKVAPITVQVENEAPEFDNFMPAHEAAYDDGDVDYTFTITDSVSGIPEPEDLPDPNDNSDYMPLVALVSGDQCYTVDPNNKTHIERKFAGNSIWCKDMPEIRAVTDDRDFDEIDDGFEVETTIVLKENERHWVTFVACDAAGNCELYTPDENKTDKALPQITIDTDEPKLIEAYTGIMWDETDEKLDYDNPTWIQVIFDDLSPLNDDTIEADDFVVQGHTVKDAKRYEDDADDGDRRMVFLELEDQLAPDEEPDVTLVPNGVADIAGNDQDEGEAEAKDRISPSFTVVSIVSPGTPEGSSNVLAGDGEEVVISITSDERIRQTQPEVTITYVNAPATCVETSVDRSKLTVKKSKGDGSTYARGEIILAGDKDNCDSKSAMGGTLGKTFEKISNTEWTVTVKEPEATGYYNIYIKAKDRSDNNNEGSEGVAPDDIDTDFFERNGDVNSGDAHYFQGDINLPNPGVWVSGIRIEETEPDVEFKTPLFVELDFTKKYISDCAKNISDDERNANCYAESDEYAKDSFDSVKVTSFTLNGADITDSVKTTDNETFLVSIDGIGIGDHKIEVQALDEAGNDFDDTLTIEFEVEERDAFSKRLSPGWNLVSLPGEPADSSISVVFGSDVEVRTVYTYDPVMPGGWMVAVRETVDSDWQGDLTEITARRGYWVLSDAIQDWDVSIPRLAGGAVGSGTPIQPPVIALYAGWNLVPVIDVTGDFDSKHDGKKGISAQAYLQSLDDGLDLARVLGFDTITNSWSTIMAPDSGKADPLEYGKAYWVFVRQAASLVPGN